jgi:MoaA/NifB/PqqE/SkfB family radical SAM enzyme
LGCNHDCEHCYLGLKRFEGMEWDDRRRVLEVMRDTGVVSLQFTGGESMIDRLFPDVYEYAHELGMVIDILTNGSRLANRRILDLRPQALPRLRRRTDRLPRQPARHGEHVQGRP